MPTTGTWYQSVGTYDGNTITQYTNGSNIASQAASGIATDTTQPIRIACRWDGQSAPTDFFPGQIGLIRIYNVALTQTQVSQNFDADRSRFGL
jgi:hypothetical protein